MARELSARSEQRLADKAAGLRATTSSELGTGYKGREFATDTTEEDEEEKKRKERLRLFSEMPLAPSSQSSLLEQAKTGPSLAIQSAVSSLEEPTSPSAKLAASLSPPVAPENPLTTAKDDFARAEQDTNWAAQYYRSLPFSATSEERAQARENYANSLKNKAFTANEIRDQLPWVQAPFVGRDTTNRAPTDPQSTTYKINKMRENAAKAGFGYYGPSVDRGPQNYAEYLMKQGVDPYSVGAMGEGTLLKGGGMDVASIPEQQAAIRNQEKIAKEIRMERAREREATTTRRRAGKAEDFDTAIDAAKRRMQLETEEGFGSNMSTDASRKMALSILRGDRSGLDRAIKEAKARGIETPLSKGRGVEAIKKESQARELEREAQKEEVKKLETGKEETEEERKKRLREERQDFLRQRRELYG